MIHVTYEPLESVLVVATGLLPGGQVHMGE
jgi:hypothetical protein